MGRREIRPTLNAPFRPAFAPPRKHPTDENQPMSLADFALLLPFVLATCTTEPPDSNPDRTDDQICNWTDAEEAAWFAPDARGHLVLTVVDAKTGAPVATCDYHAVRFAFTRDRVEPHPEMLLDGPGRPPSPDGRYRWDLAAGWHQLQIDADGYRDRWTPVFRIAAGQETRLELALRTANRLRVLVLDEHGEPLPEGGVLLVGEHYRGGLAIEDGVGERLIPADAITLSVGDVFLPDYAYQKLEVPLRDDVVNEVTIRLRR